MNSDVWIGAGVSLLSTALGAVGGWVASSRVAARQWQRDRDQRLEQATDKAVEDLLMAAGAVTLAAGRPSGVSVELQNALSRATRVAVARSARSHPNFSDLLRQLEEAWVATLPQERTISGWMEGQDASLTDHAFIVEALASVWLSDPSEMEERPMTVEDLRAARAEADGRA